MEGTDDDTHGRSAANMEQTSANREFSIRIRGETTSFVNGRSLITHVKLFFLNQFNNGCYPNQVRRMVQYWLDKSTIHIFPRWIGFTVLLFLFFLRIYLIQGYFIVAYGLGIFLLNNFIAFLSPLDDPSSFEHEDGPTLPRSDQEAREFRPFARRLPEFKFWLACTRGTLTCIVMTFFSLFDVPVFWPILLLYFFVLFFMTMKRQIMHMYKHKYVPISFGKVKRKNAGTETGMFAGGTMKGR